jgi:two-component system alkaline phosphatase synthesis response regulator PhoP
MDDRSPPRLLVVEDEPNIGATLAERLGRHGYAVTWAKSLREARNEIALGPFDLALLDVGLPDGSGFDLAEIIRQSHPGTALVFLTAFGDPQSRVQGLELGAEDYVVKPFHFKELVLRLENGLKRARHVQRHRGDDRVTVGRATIQFSRLEATVDGHTSSLTPREAAVLRYLLDHPNTAVSRDEILDAVWARDEYPSPRTVDNFIVRLRRLVETDPENPTVIRRVWGVGYQLTLPSPPPSIP